MPSGWFDDDEFLLQQQGLNGPFRGVVYALPVCLAFWIALGLIIWAVWP